jgi:hypothetical protein
MLSATASPPPRSERSLPATCVQCPTRPCSPIAFVQASLAHDTAADELRTEIVKRWGRQGVISLAFALASARVFPTIKYALGHEQACSRLTVAGSPLPVLKRAA